MQSAVPKGEGGMLAILGSDLTKIEKITLLMPLSNLSRDIK